MSEDQSVNLRTRIWCSPQPRRGIYIWQWAVDDGTEILEFGYEQTEEDAKREAEEARDSWRQIIEGK